MIKKTFMTIATSFVALCVNAQVYFGGSLCYKKVDVPGQSGMKSASAFKISPEIGYNINDTWSVGIGMGYMNADYISTNDGNLGGFVDVSTNTKLEESVSIYAIAPYVRGNFYKSKIVNLFADGIFEYERLDGVGAKANGYGFGIRPGITIKLTDRFSFVAKLGGISFASVDTDYDNGTSSRVTEFEFTLTSLDDLDFGLYFNF